MPTVVTARSRGRSRWTSSFPSRAFSRSASRCAASFAARAGSESARTFTAKRPAFVAPAGPIAKVAVGTPPGIWTMERRLSRPESALLWIGTPRTGSVVSAETIPGRWAAPPAPAMITFSPRAAAVFA